VKKLFKNNILQVDSDLKICPCKSTRIDRMTVTNIKPASVWAFLTVYDEVCDTATYWAFATMADTHRAEAIIDAAEGYDFDRTRASELAPAELRKAFDKQSCVVDDPEDLKLLVSGRGHMLRFA
jgi:hypothetical protein